MTGLLAHSRMRAATGLIAAYAIALQTLFAAFAPLPAHANAADIAAWNVLCFGSGNASPTGDGDPAAPASGAFHCVLCGAAFAAAILPEGGVAAASPLSAVAVLFPDAPASRAAQHDARAGSARAPPLTV